MNHVSNNEPTLAWSRSIAALLLALAACGGNEGTGQDEASASISDTGMCPDNGVAGCPCIEGGLCIAGALCVDGVCEPEQDEGSADGQDGETEKEPVASTGEDPTGGVGMGSCEGLCGEVTDTCACDPICSQIGDCCADYEAACPGACGSNEECASTEVCSSSTFSCVQAYGHTYGVVVESWIDYSDVCWDADSCYDADPFYAVSNCGETVFTSSAVPDTGTASWTEEAVVEAVDDCAFFIRMWDEDLASHDDILTWCITNDADQCWVLPIDILHEGYWTGTWEGAGTGGYGLEIRFRPL